MTALNWKTTFRRISMRIPLVRELYFQFKSVQHRQFVRRHIRAIPVVPTRNWPLLIGYLETAFGLGEYARGLASALQSANIQFSAYPYNCFTGRPPAEAPWAPRYDVDTFHDINIFCMATDKTRTARRIIGHHRFDKRYNILATAWELPKIPASWKADLDFFDEIWAMSRFVADAFRPVFSKPITVIPPCVDVDPNVASTPRIFGLESGTFHCLFSFDFNSRPHRKNPQAVVEAFEQAFGNGARGPSLVIKMSGAEEHYLEYVNQLETAARRNARIKILRGEFKRQDIIGLLASVDCYVSLHRAEGFGLGMAEAMALGKPVIGTGYSGNTDFLTTDTGYPVPFHLRAVEAEEYPYAYGNLWAEPNVEAASYLMRQIVADPSAARMKGAQGRLYVQKQYSPSAIGTLIGSRLHVLSSNDLVARRYNSDPRR